MTSASPCRRRGDAARGEQELLEPVRRARLVGHRVSVEIERLDPAAARGSRRRGRGCRGTRTLLLPRPEPLREGRPRVRIVLLGAEHPDGSVRVVVADPTDGGVAGHPTPDDQIPVLRHARDGNRVGQERALESRRRARRSLLERPPGRGLRGGCRVPGGGRRGAAADGGSVAIFYYPWYSNPSRDGSWAHWYVDRDEPRRCRRRSSRAEALLVVELPRGRCADARHRCGGCRHRGRLVVGLRLARGRAATSRPPGRLTAGTDRRDPPRALPRPDARVGGGGYRAPARRRRDHGLLRLRRRPRPRRGLGCCARHGRWGEGLRADDARRSSACFRVRRRLSVRRRHVERRALPSPVHRGAPVGTAVHPVGRPRVRRPARNE